MSPRDLRGTGRKASVVCAKTTEGTLRQLDRRIRRRKAARWLVGSTVVGALAVVALLMSRDVLLPPRSRVNYAGRRAQCRSNLKQLGLALHMYANDHEGRFPPNLLALAPDYVTDPHLYQCPLGAWGTDEPTEVHFVYVSGLLPSDAPDLIVAFDEETNHADHGDSVNVLFVNGSAERMRSVDDLHAKLEAQARKLKESGRTIEILRPRWSKVSWRLAQAE